MVSQHKDDVSLQLRTALLGLVPKPSRAFRRRAWKTFEEALDRHLASRGGGLSPAETRR